MSENIDFIQRIVTWIEENQIFSRERKSNEQRALGMLLYKAGLSYKKVGSFVNASHEVVREWYQKGKELFKELMGKKAGRYLQLYKIVSTLSLGIFKEINLVLPCPPVVFNRVLIIPNISSSDIN